MAESLTEALKPALPSPEDLPAESPDGVDLTLIQWTLSLTPSSAWSSSRIGWTGSRSFAVAAALSVKFLALLRVLLRHGVDFFVG